MASSPQAAAVGGKRKWACIDEDTYIPKRIFGPITIWDTKKYQEWRTHAPDGVSRPVVERLLADFQKAYGDVVDPDPMLDECISFGVDKDICWLSGFRQCQNSTRLVHTEATSAYLHLIRILGFNMNHLRYYLQRQRDVEGLRVMIRILGIDDIPMTMIYEDLLGCNNTVDNFGEEWLDDGGSAFTDDYFASITGRHLRQYFETSDSDALSSFMVADVKLERVRLLASHFSMDGSEFDFIRDWCKFITKHDDGLWLDDHSRPTITYLCELVALHLHHRKKLKLDTLGALQALSLARDLHGMIMDYVSAPLPMKPIPICADVHRYADNCEMYIFGRMEGPTIRLCLQFHTHYDRDYSHCSFLRL